MQNNKMSQIMIDLKYQRRMDKSYLIPHGYKRIGASGYYISKNRLGKNTNSSDYRGANSAVYKGYSEKQKQHVAVKIVANQGRQKQIQREKRAFDNLSNLRHNNIIQFHYIYETQRATYLFLQLCRGDLLDRIQQNIEDQLQVLRYFKQILQGMLFISSQNYVHRDLKADNILLDWNNVIKISDFGKACLIKGGYEQICAMIVNSSGNLLNKSPEALNSNKYYRQSDVWSIGVILYQMLHGTKQVERIYGDSMQEQYEIKFKKIQQEHQKIARGKMWKCRQNINYRWNYLICWMMTYQYQKRPTFQQVQDKFKKVQKLMEVQITQKKKGIDKPQNLRKKWLDYSYQKIQIYFQPARQLKRTSFKFIDKKQRYLLMIFSLAHCALKMQKLKKKVQNNQALEQLPEDLQIRIKNEKCQQDIVLQSWYQLKTSRASDWFFFTLQKVVEQFIQANAFKNMLNPNDQQFKDLAENIRQKKFQISQNYYVKKYHQILKSIKITNQKIKDMDQNQLKVLLAIRLADNCETQFPDKDFIDKHPSKYLNQIMASKRQNIVSQIVHLAN